MNRHIQVILRNSLSQQTHMNKFSPNARGISIGVLCAAYVRFCGITAIFFILVFILPLFSCGKPYSQWSGLLSGAYPKEAEGPTHIDTHQGTYNWHPDLAKGVMRLSLKYNLPMIPHPAHVKAMRKKGYVFPDTYWMFLLIAGEKYMPEYRKKVYDNWLRNLKPGVHQLIIHPSFMSEEYKQFVWRPYVLTGDRDYWTSSETKDLAGELGIIFIGFKELQRLQAKNWNLNTDGVIWAK
jgi:hypothetical protein